MLATLAKIYTTNIEQLNEGTLYYYVQAKIEVIGIYITPYTLFVLEGNPKINWIYWEEICSEKSQTKSECNCSVSIAPELGPFSF